MENTKTTKQICLMSSELRLNHKEEMSGESRDLFNSFYFKKWVSLEECREYIKREVEIQMKEYIQSSVNEKDIKKDIWACGQCNDPLFRISPKSNTENFPVICNKCIEELGNELHKYKQSSANEKDVNK